MNNTDLFPLIVASGKAFCNREQERIRLKNNFKLGKHTLVTSPRRYGKTSLILKAIEESAHHCIHVDLFSCLNTDDMEKKMLGSIEIGITNMIPKINEALQTIKFALANLHLSLDLYHGAVTLKIERAHTNNPKQNLLYALQGVEKIVSKFSSKKRLVFFIDEFQELANLDDAKVIEAIIREHAQISQSLCFVFSGSNRHLLANIFEDSQRPLYMLCDKLALQRISAASYIQHLNQAAATRWQTTLSPEALTKILELTVCHSYYVNVLCGKLWIKDEMPNVEQVENTWNNYATEEISRVAQTIDKLSENQRKLLITLSKLDAVREPTAQQFLSLVNLSGASVRQALKTLIKNDLVYLNDDGSYCVLDPLFKTVLSR